MSNTTNCLEIPKTRVGLYAASAARRRETTNNTYVAEINAMWQADLADMQGIAKQNGGRQNLLIVIKVFCKFP